jgi:hypothetical protein
MNAKKGGYTVQRLYGQEGRRPTEIATLVPRNNAGMLRDAKERERQGPASASPSQDGGLYFTRGKGRKDSAGRN